MDNFGVIRNVIPAEVETPITCIKARRPLLACSLPSGYQIRGMSATSLAQQIKPDVEKVK